MAITETNREIEKAAVKLQDALAALRKIKVSEDALPDRLAENKAYQKLLGKYDRMKAEMRGVTDAVDRLREEEAKLIAEFKTADGQAEMTAAKELNKVKAKIANALANRDEMNGLLVSVEADLAAMREQNEAEKLSDLQAALDIFHETRRAVCDLGEYRGRHGGEEGLSRQITKEILRIVNDIDRVVRPHTDAQRDARKRMSKPEPPPEKEEKTTADQGLVFKTEYPKTDLAQQEKIYPLFTDGNMNPYREGHAKDDLPRELYEKHFVNGGLQDPGDPATGWTPPKDSTAADTGQPEAEQDPVTADAKDGK